MSRSQPKPHRFLPTLETLEDRWCPSASMNVVDGHTLLILGDRSDNHLAIVQDASGVHVTDDNARGVWTPADPARGVWITSDSARGVWVPADSDRGVWVPTDGAPTVNFTGIDKILVDTGAGDDVVTFRTTIDPNYHTADLFARLGAGNDTFNADFVNPPEPDRPVLVDPPEPDRFAVWGEAGDDTFNTLIGSETTLTPPTTAQGGIDLMLDGGQGNDTFLNAMRNITLNGFVNVDVQGGTGADRVVETFDKVTVNAGLNLNVDGGQGDDDLSLIAESPATRSEVDLGRDAEARLALAFDPALIAGSRVQMRLEGGTGTDRFHGKITPCILPQGALDLVFAGGRGADVFDISVTMEPVEHDPPSEFVDHEPPSERDGPMSLTVLGGDGDDQLTLRVQNLDDSTSPLTIELDGGGGRNSAIVSPGIAAGGWQNHNQTFVRDV